MSNPLNDGDQVAVDITDDELARLRRLNVAAGALHLVSGVVMSIIASDFTLPITTFNLNGPPGTPVSQGTLSTLVDVQLAPLTAGFLYLSAFFHIIIATVGFEKYGDELRRGRNRFRWVEYALSSTLMIITIAMITTITDLAALIAIAFTNVAMILFGWIMEMVNRPGEQVWWTPYWFGCVAGAGPWVAIGAYIATGDEQPPGFVYGIIISIFLLFNSFAVTQLLQYRQVGRWADYLVGERSYITLSFVAKSVLAWQLYANVLVPDDDNNKN
eukprot:TRINITY_DN65938_c9_g1_i3.p1 TRINITY_DN65938_c9_g1~~TRINITY_DN65938_c9_g1_i3.p1  ORF type:complete len:288 (+),score=122.00 TRINITY_DN65938_c9_g1_i3:51-866(+)